MIVVIAILLVVIALAACAPKPATSIASTVAPAPIVTDPATAEAHAGAYVEIRGSARDAKISAVIVGGGGFVVYCVGVDRWPAANLGQPIVARGTLERSSDFEAHHGPNGEVNQGTSGPVWVLRDCAIVR